MKLGTDNQNIQGAQKTQLLKIHEPIKKWATELNRTFSKEKVQREEGANTVYTCK
jgi:hypothetical protein